MAIAFVISTSKGTAINGGTSNAIDTTGCNLLVIGIHHYSSATLTVSDSKGNTWTALTHYATTLHTGVRLYYCLNPTVGSGHTFTISSTGRYPTITVLGFSGVKDTSPFHSENGSSSDVAGTSRQPGSVTPPEDGCLIVTGLVLSNAVTSQAINSSMTLQEYVNYTAANYMGGGIAYYVQATAAAINPTWSWAGSVRTSAAIAVFKPEPAASTLTPRNFGGKFQRASNRHLGGIFQRAV